MPDLEAKMRNERPRKVYDVEVSVDGNPVTFSIVHSMHGFATTEQEIQDTDALLLEGVNAEPGWKGKNEEYRLALEKSGRERLPIAIIDVDANEKDTDKIFTEMLTTSVSLAGASILVYSAFKNLTQGLPRRAFLKGIASLPLLTPLGGQLADFADHRPGGLSGEIVRKVAEIDDENPLGLKITTGLRNRIFAFKALMVARFLLQQGDKKNLKLSIIIGAGHTDTGRLLRQLPDALRQEIIEMCTTYEMSPGFLLSAGRAEIGTYKSGKKDLSIMSIVDEQLVRLAFFRAGRGNEIEEYLDKLKQSE